MAETRHAAPAPGPRPPTPANLIGRTLGPYRIEAFLGRGGMSTVYRAVQTRLERPVALKLLPPDLAGDQVLVARFLQEARAAAALQHPNIIPVYDSGQVDGYYYIAMRYVEGVTLARAITERGLALPRVLAIVEQLASALDYAHARGVIHRDVSAGNVMLEPGDRVTLMDFGIAQARQGSRLTRAGVAVGTLEYLSPEQARGELSTPRSDVYALGVLSFELLTGRLPFSAADDRALLLQHLNAVPPSARALRPDLPAGVEAALTRCLAKDPQARFAAAGAFAAALRTAVAENGRRTIAAPPPSPAPARPLHTAPVRTAAAPPVAQPPRGGPRLTHARPRRRLLRWALAGLVLLALALAGGAAAQNFGGIAGAPLAARLATATSGRRAAPTATAHAGSAVSASSARASAPAGTPTPPPQVTVPPAVSPEAAVNAYYGALYNGLRGDAAGLALAYGYLSGPARAQLSFADFLRQYSGDTGLYWHYYGQTLAADGKSATVPVDLTEYRSGNPVASSFTWVAVLDGANGWRLDHTTSRQQAAAPAQGNNGHGKGDKKGNGQGD